MGIALGMQPIIGFNKGAGYEGRVKETFKKAVGVATLISIIGWLGCALFPESILRLFGMDEPAYMEFGVRCMRIFVLFILRPILLLIPLIHIFSYIWGLNGILYASPIADYLTALLIALLLWHDRKRKG